MSGASREATGRVVGGVRGGAGVFVLADRGLVTVTGDDRERWLNGMLTGDVEALGGERNGCYALRLDRKGRILADVHVWRREDAYWLELAAPAVGPLLEDLDRFIIADDVTLTDRSAEFDRVAIEGPEAAAVLANVLGGEPGLADEAFRIDRWGEEEVVVAAFGWSGEPAYQVAVAAGRGQPFAAATLEAARSAGLPVVEGDAEALEVLRVEAGIPAWGREIDLEVFPDEARLARAVSTTKGCYTGQEIVARLRSRGQVNHLLVGLVFDSVDCDAPVPEDTVLRAGDRATGEVTSSVWSPSAGCIGLGYARREHSEPGTELAWEGGTARVVALPMVETAREAKGSRA
ncbi:MAG: YgfZ/GcvT domain-containing protein [Myxococcota bacterium]